MKKILLFITTIGALLLGACSEDNVDVNKIDYVTISGNWEMHVTASNGYSDSIIKHPNRLVQMTWSDMVFDAEKQQTVINSQITVGNGVWRLKSYIAGNQPGTYAMLDSSSATYTYTTKPSATDSLTILNYKLTGDIVWEPTTTINHGKLTYNAVATSEDGKEVKFVGIATSTLAQ